MKVSIVTISFNQVGYLGRTIQSVLGQDYPDIEYIVVDPGSTDGSRDLIKSYESRLARIIFEKDSGPADGLNKGFSAATGEIFGFLNSDDILYPGAISGAVDYFVNHPKTDVVSGNGNVIGPDERVYRVVYSDRLTPRKYMYGGAVLIQPSTFFRRSAFEKAGRFNPENRAIWDGELFFDMARAGCVFGRKNEIWSGFPLTLLRIWRHGKARIEDRWMDEHMYLTDGRTVTFRGGFADHNLYDLTFFTAKHNAYASREALDSLNRRHNLFDPQLELTEQATAKQAKVKRFLKESIYNKLPFEISATLFFLYRYIFQLGFLDGRRGLTYHVLQGFWYRFLVGAKLGELEHAVRHASSDAEMRAEIERLTRQKLTSLL